MSEILEILNILEILKLLGSNTKVTREQKVLDNLYQDGLKMRKMLERWPG